MDPETEKRLAALIMEEAARLRMQADKEGVHVYLSKPKIRGRPNPQFLQATVRGIQQANRAAEVSDMWRLREKEIELERARERHIRATVSGERREIREATRARGSDRHDSKQKREFYYKSEASNSFVADSGSDDHHYRDGKSSAMKRHIGCATDSSSENEIGHSYETPDDMRDEGLNDEEVEHFLRSRVKRGRGAIGSRMDEPGPYPLPQPGDSFHDVRSKEGWEERIMGPAAGPSNELPSDFILKKGELKNKKKHKGVESVEGRFDEVKLKERHGKRKEKKEKRKKKHKSQERVSKKRRKHQYSGEP